MGVICRALFRVRLNSKLTMSWIYKVDQRFERFDLEKLLNALDKEATDFDISDDKAANYQEIDEVFILGALFMGIFLPFLTCKTYVLCLRIMAKLLPNRSSTDMDPETIKKETAEKQSSSSGISLLRCVMFILAVAVIFPVSAIHSEVSQRWKT